MHKPRRHVATPRGAPIGASVLLGWGATEPLLREQRGLVQWSKQKRTRHPTCGGAVQPGNRQSRGALLRGADAGGLCHGARLNCARSHMSSRGCTWRSQRSHWNRPSCDRGVFRLWCRRVTDRRWRASSHACCTARFDLAPQSANFLHQHPHGLLVCLTHIHQRSQH